MWLRDSFNDVTANHTALVVFDEQGMQVTQNLPPAQAAGLRRASGRAEVDFKDIDVDRNIDVTLNVAKRRNELLI